VILAFPAGCGKPSILVPRTLRARTAECGRNANPPRLANIGGTGLWHLGRQGHAITPIRAILIPEPPLPPYAIGVMALIVCGHGSNDVPARLGTPRHCVLASARQHHQRHKGRKAKRAEAQDPNENNSLPKYR
jgi:hypothetical protein